MALTLKDLSLTYGDRTVFDALSHTFPERGCVLLVGESGSGKTCLLRILAGLCAPDAGEVLNRPSSVSVSFQEYRLFPSLTAAENIALAAFGSVKATARAKEMLLSLGFTERETGLFPRALSGGMRQRVSLARAFLYDTPLLLLDEPFKELDPENAKRVAREIEEQAKARLVVLSTHTGAVADLPATQILTIGKAPDITPPQGEERIGSPSRQNM